MVLMLDRYDGAGWARRTTMVPKSTVVTARSELNKLNSARRAQAWPRVNSVSQLSELGSRLPRPFPLAREWRPANPTPIEHNIGASTPTGTILDFVRARNGRSSAQNHEAPWNENHDSLTLIDLVAIAGLFLTTVFFYTATAWLLLLS
jgi:hypothetical protein